MKDSGNIKEGRIVDDLPYIFRYGNESESSFKGRKT
jgi:hypothetical protein